MGRWFNLYVMVVSRNRTVCLFLHSSRTTSESLVSPLLYNCVSLSAGFVLSHRCSENVDISSSIHPSLSVHLMQTTFVVRHIIHVITYDNQSIYISQDHPHSIRCMQQTLHLQIIFTMTITIHSLVIASPLTEQFLDVLDALRLLLVLTHHAQGGREELLAVLHLIWKVKSVKGFSKQHTKCSAEGEF